MVTSHCEQSHGLAISECPCSARLRDAQRTDDVHPLRRSHTDDFFALQPHVPVNLRPSHLADFVQGVQGSCVRSHDGRRIGRSPSQGRVQINCGLRLMQAAFMLRNGGGGVGGGGQRKK
jgi:hypothetical protein